MKYKDKKQQKKKFVACSLELILLKKILKSLKKVFKAISERHRDIKKSTKTSLIDKISKRLLGLEIKSNHLIITKVLIEKSCQKSIAIMIKPGLKRKKDNIY